MPYLIKIEIIMTNENLIELVKTPLKELNYKLYNLTNNQVKVVKMICNQNWAINNLVSADWFRFNTHFLNEWDSRLDYN
jgi:hypothetical protein